LQDQKNFYKNATYLLAFRQLDTILYNNDYENREMTQVLEKFTYE